VCFIKVVSHLPGLPFLSIQARRAPEGPRPADPALRPRVLLSGPCRLPDPVSSTAVKLHGSDATPKNARDESRPRSGRSRPSPSPGATSSSTARWSCSELSRASTWGSPTIGGGEVRSTRSSSSSLRRAIRELGPAARDACYGANPTVWGLSFPVGRSGAALILLVVPPIDSPLSACAVFPHSRLSGSHEQHVPSSRQGVASTAREWSI